MKKSFYAAIVCLSLFPLISCAQTQSNGNEPKAQITDKSKVKTEETKTDAEQIKADYPNLKPQADEMGQAFIKSDFDKFADFMYPKVLEIVGGKVKFISSLDSSMKQMRSTGFEVISYEVGEPNQAIVDDNQVFAVLPTKTTMRFQQKIVTDQGSIIAVSNDKGTNWKFVRVKSKESIKPLFPNVVDKLTLFESVIK